MLDKLPNKLRILIPYAVTVVILAIIMYIAKIDKSKIFIFSELSFLTIFNVTFIFLIFQFIHSQLLKYMLNFSDCHLDSWTSFKLTCLRTYYNYLPLSTGMFATALYLKKEKDFESSTFFGIQAFLLSIKLFSFGIFGLVISLVLYFNDLIVPNEILIFMVFLSLLPIFSKLPIYKFKSDNKIYKFLNSIFIGFKEYSNDYARIFVVSFFSLLSLILMSFRFWLISEELDIGLSPQSVFFITLFNNILRVTTILPGNLGLRQTIAGTITVFFSMDFIDGFIPSLVEQLLSMFVTFFLGIIFTFTVSTDMLRSSH